jgi:hypothetical protein
VLPRPLIALTLLLQSSLEGVINNWTTTFLQQARGIEAREALFVLADRYHGAHAARRRPVWHDPVMRFLADANACSSSFMSTGTGASHCMSAPLAGCTRPRRQACSA